MTDIDRSTTYKKKHYKNNERGKAIMQNFANTLYRTKDELERFERNYNVMNGYIDPKDYEYTLKFKIGGNKKKKIKAEDVNIGYKKIRHHPLIMTVTEDIMGVEKKIPLTVAVKSISPDINNEKLQKLQEQISINFNKATNNALIKKSILKNIQLNVELGLLDPDDAEMQIENIDTDPIDIDVKGITDRVEKEELTPIEIDGQMVMDYLIKKLNVRKVKSETIEDIIPTYSMFIKVGMNRDEVVYERMSPSDFSYIPSPHSPYVQDGVAGVHFQYVSLQQAFSMDGEYFSKSDIKKLENMALSGIGGELEISTFMGKSIDVIESENIVIGSNDDNIVFNDYDSRMVQYASMGIDVFSKILERRYIAWKDFRKWKKVTRNIDGVEQIHYESENYTFNPDIDIDIEEIELPEVWHGIMYGNGDDAVFIKVEELAYPKINPLRPWEQKLPFFGGELNTKNGKAKNRSLIDGAIEYNYEYDLYSEIYKKDSATNFGQVLSFVQQFKPDNMQWQEFFTMMHDLSQIHIDPYKEELLDGRFIEAMNTYKTLNLSKDSKLRSIIEHLIYLEQRISKVMLFNEMASGSIGQYAKAANVNAALNATQSRLSNMFQKQQEIIEESLQYMFNMAIQYYADHQEKISYVFKSVDRVFKNLDWRGLITSDIGIKITTNPEELGKIELVRNNMLTTLQNSFLDYEGFIDAVDASSMNEFRRLARGISERAAIEKEKSMQQAMAIEQQKGAIEQQKIDKEAELKIKLQQMKNEVNYQIALVEVEKFAKTLDINKDGVNDMNELQRTKNAIKLKELEVKKMEVLANIKNKQREIDLKEMALNKQLKKSKNKRLAYKTE